MKKLFLIPLICGFLSSCSQSEPIVPQDSNPPVSEFSNLRSVDDAIKIAQTVAGAMSKDSRTVKTVDYMDVNTIYSDLSRADGDELMYVVNYTDNDGFVIVSAQKSADPVLAVVEEGNFNSPETKSNENFQNALSMIDDKGILYQHPTGIPGQYTPI